MEANTPRLRRMLERNEYVNEVSVHNSEVFAHLDEGSISIHEMMNVSQYGYEVGSIDFYDEAVVQFSPKVNPFE